ncbi:MAG: hypothetical protein LBL13_07025, partial [Bacteroidales bacterium]|nr:hypothetical protein [Bacteroidales bacterium]
MAGEIKLEIAVKDINSHSVVEQTKNNIKNLSSFVNNIGRPLDSAFLISKENINIQKQVIKELEKELKNAQKSFDDFGYKGNTLENHKALTAELEKEKSILEQMKANVGKSIGDGIISAENLRIQEKAVGELTMKLFTLDKTIQSKGGDVENLEKLDKELKSIKGSLDAEKQSLLEMNAEMERNATTNERLATLVRLTRDAMTKLSLEGGKDTDQYRQLNAELVRLQSEMAKVNQQTKVLTSTKGMFQGFTSGITGVTGAFTAAQGAMGLFGSKNEDLQKVMMKVQSAMAITIGLQQVQQTLLKEGAFRTLLVAKAKDIWAKSVAFLNTQLKVNIALSKVFATSGIGIIIAAIGMLIYIISSGISKMREAKKAQEEFNKSIIEAAAKPLESIDRLSKAWKNLGDSITEKNKFIKDHKKDFEELGASIRSVSDAENLLVNNTAKFIESIKQKARATAAQKKAEELYSQLTEQELKRENEIEKLRKQDLKLDDARKQGIYVNGELTYSNNTITKAETEIKKLEKEIDKLYEYETKAAKEAQKALAESGVTAAENVIEGTIAYYDKLITEKQEQLNNTATTNAGYKKLDAEIKKLEAEKRKITGEELKKELFMQKLEKIKKEYEDFYNWTNSPDKTKNEGANEAFKKLLEDGNTYIEYLQKLQEKYKDDAATLKKINNEIAKEEEKRFKTQIEQYKDKLDE